ncbi:MAG: hypothetical protein M3405_14805 [Acidobacteriota bacterium]|jgi:hypothetical protein|nr:hypothetical protein [Acidobacteriota bacterium]
MSKVVVFLLGGILGLILGGVIVFFSFVGTPQATELPGDPIQPPQQGGTPPATAQIVLKQEFFNEILQTIFVDMNPPSFPLQLTSNLKQNKDSNVLTSALLQENQCDGKIKLLKEGSGVKTGVNFEEENIKAPLAFSGSANILGQCINFSGWSQANLVLRFDKENQKVFGTINVETINLDGISPIFSNFLTPLIQGSLNQNVNPIQIIDGKQIAVQIPITATNGTLNAEINDVRAEVKDKALNLYVTYGLKGSKNN